jgi:hypothetical protein
MTGHNNYGYGALWSWGLALLMFNNSWTSDSLPPPPPPPPHTHTHTQSRMRAWVGSGGVRVVVEEWEVGTCSSLPGSVSIHLCGHHRPLTFTVMGEWH